MVLAHCEASSSTPAKTAVFKVSNKVRRLEHALLTYTTARTIQAPIKPYMTMLVIDERSKYAFPVSQLGPKMVDTIESDVKFEDMFNQCSRNENVETVAEDRLWHWPF